MMFYFWAKVFNDKAVQLQDLLEYANSKNFEYFFMIQRPRELEYELDPVLGNLTVEVPDTLEGRCVVFHNNSTKNNTKCIEAFFNSR